MPQDWRSLFGETAGVARFSRWFNCPTNLDPDERVRVSFAGLRGTGHISMNGVSLKQVTTNDQSPTVEITAALQPRNRLEVELRFDPAASSSPGGLFGEIAIQIAVGQAAFDDVADAAQ
jgi:hypothetical protein